MDLLTRLARLGDWADIHAALYTWDTGKKSHLNCRRSAHLGYPDLQYGSVPTSRCQRNQDKAGLGAHKHGEFFFFFFRRSIVLHHPSIQGCTAAHLRDVSVPTGRACIRESGLPGYFHVMDLISPSAPRAGRDIISASIIYLVLTGTYLHRLPRMQVI